MLHNEIADNQQQADELQCGFKLLHGQYQIEGALSSGGFGITYLARDSLDRRVVIKECFAAGICDRAGGLVTPISPPYAKQYKTVLRHFLREAQWLARSVHPGIVGIHQVFRENNTAYIAMEFIDGIDLVTLREEQPKRVNNALLQDILEQALGTLAFIHGLGILHRDISPDNFLLGSDGTVTLIDFGAASGDQPDQDAGPDPVLAVKDGYSAHELYQQDMPQRPASDLYSLGATLYYLVTGTPPPKSRHRLDALAAGNPDPCLALSEGFPDFDPDFLGSIDKAMSVLPGVRYQSAQEWLDELQVKIQQPRAATSRPAVGPISEPLEINAELENMLASLVENTNSGLVPGLPKSATQDKPETPQTSPEPTSQPRQLVDIFGDPISNVETWLLEQDQVSKRKRPAPATIAETAAPESQSNQRPASGRFFTKLIPVRLRQIFGGAASQHNDLPAAKSKKERS